MKMVSSCLKSARNASVSPGWCTPTKRIFLMLPGLAAEWEVVTLNNNSPKCSICFLFSHDMKTEVLPTQSWSFHSSHFWVLPQWPSPQQAKALFSIIPSSILVVLIICFLTLVFKSVINPIALWNYTHFESVWQIKPYLKKKKVFLLAWELKVSRRQQHRLFVTSARAAAAVTSSK